MDFCWAAGAKRSNSTKKKRRRRRTSRAPFSSWLSETQREQWNGCEAFFLRLYNVTTQLLNLPCLRYFLLLPVYPLLPRQNMSDVWFFWHMWSTVSLNVPAPFISATLCTPVLISTLLFIAGPSEPPSLNIIIVIIIIAHILSDPSSSFFFFNCQPQEKKAEKRDKVRDKTADGPRLFLFPFFLALARSCQSLQLCRAEELAPKRLRSSSAAVRAAAWCYNWEAKSAEGEGSRAQRAIPQAASNELTLWDDRKDDCTATLFLPSLSWFPSIQTFMQKN